MKKSLLTLIAVAGLAWASNAQEFGFGKGDVIIEGSFQSSNTNDRNTHVKNSAFTFTPKAGYFLSDKIAVGVDLAFGQEKETKQVSATEHIETGKTFGAGLFGRYYFLEVGSRFKPYAELGAAYANARGHNEVGGVKTDAPKVNGFGANAGIGANYFLTERLAVNFAFANVINYTTAKADVTGAESVSSFNTNVNVFENFFDSATFGLTFKF